MPSVPEKLATLQAYIRELQNDVSCLPEMKRELTQISTEMDRLQADCIKYDEGCTDIIRIQERQKHMESRVESLAAKIKEFEKATSFKVKKINDLLKDYPEIAKNFELSEDMKKEAMKYVAKYAVVGFIIMVGLGLGINLGAKLLFGS